MQAVCVSIVSTHSHLFTRVSLPRSIYQDIPLYNLDEFLSLAPPEARTDDVLHNEHQLMLNRLSFELVERQRC
jgi:Fms-interacting protein/Thoc5